MTHDEIAKLDAAQLRLAIAEEYGWKDMQMVYPEDPEYYAWHAEKWVRVPDWPRDIAPAWELVEEAQAKPHECYFEISHTPAIPHKGKPCWHVELGGVRGYGETAPLAICRAWLMWKQT